jgi:pantoate--beta-alanine ligase
MKLFNIVRPHIAYFGQKDAQQAIIIRKMAEDLNVGVKIKIMPTLREKDGLAMSSRNTYLNREERKDAGILYHSLQLARKSLKHGNRSALDIIRKMRQLINQKKNARVQYISVVDLENLKQVNKIRGKVLIALAVWIGKTRLIDNIII